MTSSGKVRRNDPCPCGSGKKYKQCCLARDREAQAERVAWDRAAQDMRTALIGYARDEAYVKDLAQGLGLFWEDRYTTETIHLMSVDESLRFFDWFAHDYALQAVEDPAQTGKRLLEVYRAELDDALSPKEAAILDGWIESLPGSALVVRRVDPGQGTVVLDDLFLERHDLEVHDPSAAVHGEVDQILLARPLPEHDRLRLSGATVILPAGERQGLQAYVQAELEAYQAEHPQVTAERWLRERAYRLTHYALQWAEREGRPAVAAEDPEASGVGGRALKTVVKWQQDRVRTR